jgi:hypothetical protein
MNKLNSIFTILIIIAFSFVSFGQEYEMESKIVTGIFEVNDKTKSDLFSEINKWISINYKSSKNVIQLNDKEAGVIIIKGTNEVQYENAWKELYKKKGIIPKYSNLKINHLIEINIKDNKFRIIYKISDIEDLNNVFNNMVIKNCPNCIALNKINENSITECNEFIDDYLKRGMLGKKKRIKFISMTNEMFKLINSTLILDIKQIMNSIHKSVLSEKKNDW